MNPIENKYKLSMYDWKVILYFVIYRKAPSIYKIAKFWGDLDNRNDYSIACKGFLDRGEFTKTAEGLKVVEEKLPAPIKKAWYDLNSIPKDLLIRDKESFLNLCSLLLDDFMEIMKKKIEIKGSKSDMDSLWKTLEKLKP